MLINNMYQWISGEDGQDLIEYGLIAFLISIVVVGVLPGIGKTVVEMYNWIVTQIPPI